MKVTTDSCLFGAWAAKEVQSLKAKSSKSVLDIGGGSGLLSLMMAQKNNVEIDAIEIDREAALQAAENVLASPFKKQITIINEDLLQWKPTKKYDVIISNPPFYEGSLKSGKQEKNTAHHSTQLSLEKLLYFIQRHLIEGGKFFLMLPYYRLEEFQSCITKNQLYMHQLLRVKQTITHTPFRLMIEGLNKKLEKVLEDEISIKDDKQQYTQHFVSLLKDYYLHL